MEEQIAVAVATTNAYLENYNKLTQDSAVYEELSNYFNQYMENYDATLSLSAMNNTREVTAQVNGVLTEIFNQLNDEIEKLVEQEQTNLGLAKGQQTNIYQNAVIIAGGMLLIMVIVFAVSVFAVFMTIVFPTKRYEKNFVRLSAESTIRTETSHREFRYRRQMRLGILCRGSICLSRHYRISWDRLSIRPATLIMHLDR